MADAHFRQFWLSRAQNPMVVGMFTVSSLLIAASVYPVLDMDVPLHGPVKIYEPLRRALAEMTL
jgi:hypothetical protein